jgi:hypothetical protein
VIIKLPPSSSGLENNDGTLFNTLTDAITSGGNTLSNSVLSREDAIFIECWIEAIEEKDIVYPYGAVQYRLNNLHL